MLCLFVCAAIGLISDGSGMYGRGVSVCVCCYGSGSVQYSVCSFALRETSPLIFTSVNAKCWRKL